MAKQINYKSADVRVVFVPGQGQQEHDSYDVYVVDELWGSYMYRQVAETVARRTMAELDKGHFKFTVSALKSLIDELENLT